MTKNGTPAPWPSPTAVSTLGTETMISSWTKPEVVHEPGSDQVEQGLDEDVPGGGLDVVVDPMYAPHRHHCPLHPPGAHQCAGHG